MNSFFPWAHAHNMEFMLTEATKNTAAETTLLFSFRQDSVLFRVFRDRTNTEIDYNVYWFNLILSVVIKI